MMRPRNRSGAASCIDALEFADHTVNPAPVRNRSAPASSAPRIGASSSSEPAKTSEPTIITFADARPRAAATSAPASAPAPKTAERIPNTSACVCNVVYASTGSVTLKLKQNVLKTTVSPSTTSMRGCRRT